MANIVSFDSMSDATGGHERSSFSQPTAPRLRGPNHSAHDRLDLLGDSTSAPSISEDDMSIDLSDESFGPDQSTNYGHERPYTSGLGVPDHLSQGTKSVLSIISDAGDLQHQEQVVGPGADPCPASSDQGDALEFIPDLATDHELQTSIMNAMQPSQDHDLGFLPKSQLYHVITRENVRLELSRKLLYTGSFTHEDIKNMADTICTRTAVQHRGKPKIKSFRKIFALLVLTEKSESIPLFLAEDVSDLDLPLINVGGRRSEVDLRRQDTEGNPAKERLRCFQQPKWSPFKLLNFEKYQWALLAPFFSHGKQGGVCHYLLHKQHVLPFVHPELGGDDQEEFYGGFAKVFTVHIHEDHHEFRNKRLCNRGFAIKEPYDSDRKTFQKEVDILKKFSGERSHEHIVELLATYEQSNRFHFIFHRAEGTLFDYWGKVKWSSPMTFNQTVWVAKQFAGLAEGLLRLHRHLTFKFLTRYREDEDSLNKSTRAKQVKFMAPDPLDHVRSDSMQSNGVLVRPDSPVTRPPPRSRSSDLVPEERFGRHGDIKPSNILWYADKDDSSDTPGATLKIADFGQAELNSLLSRTKQRDVANTLTYRPPECDLQQPALINQSYDIWCLGCVYLEFVTWALGGVKLVEHFSISRRAPDPFMQNMEADTFFQIIRNEETNQPEVMIKKSVTHFIADLHQRKNCTEYFHKVLDMIQNNMLLVDARQRKSCKYIWETLRDLHQECVKDANFATRANPWCANPRWISKPVSRSYEVDMSEEATQVIQNNLPLHPLQPFLRLHRR